MAQKKLKKYNYFYITKKRRRKKHLTDNFKNDESMQDEYFFYCGPTMFFKNLTHEPTKLEKDICFNI